MKILLKNCNIIDPLIDYKDKNQILIENGIIEKILYESDEIADLIIDVKGKAVTPGFIDMHCHLREPGFEYKETIKAGTMAAAKGGYTTVCCMPNTNPIIDNVNSLKKLKEIVCKDAIIDVIPIGAVTVGQKGIKLVDLDKMLENGVWMFSDDGNPVWNEEIMEECLSMAKTKNLLIIDHCEDLDLVSGGVINEGSVSKRLGLRGISNASEVVPIKRNIKIAQRIGAPVHIAHISTQESLNAIKEAKERGIQITCEVMPHHISLCDEDIVDENTDFKVNPPLRSKIDVEALRAGLSEGIIDVIATDHAPHNYMDKPGDFYKAANGISGLETAFSICYTYLVRNKYITLRELIKFMCLNPAKLLNIYKGRIKEGYVADLTVTDLERNFIVNKNDFVSKGKNTPFHGKKLWAEVQMTIGSGELVYRKE